MLPGHIQRGVQGSASMMIVWLEPTHPLHNCLLSTCIVPGTVLHLPDREWQCRLCPRNHSGSREMQYTNCAFNGHTEVETKRKPRGGHLKQILTHKYEFSRLVRRKGQSRDWEDTHVGQGLRDSCFRGVLFSLMVKTVPRSEQYG